jgi:hypothetical protein
MITANESTWLYPVELRGRATGQVESLTGYIARVAEQHLVTPSTLLHRGLEWWDVGKPEMIGVWSRRTTHLRLRSEVNGNHSAERWTALLARLSGVQHLAQSTTNRWSHLFPARRLTKSHHAWCPDCYAEENGCYDRLLWCLSPVEVCPIHKCPLATHCPSCRGLVPNLHAQSSPGKCPKCRGSLSELFPQRPSAPTATSLQLCNANTVASFLSAVVSGASIPTTRCPTSHALKRCIDLVGIDGVGSLAHRLGVPKTTAWCWLADRAVPDLRNTLKICHTFGLSLLEVLTGEFALVVANPPNQAPEISRRRPRHSVDGARLRVEIAALRGKRQDGELSLNSIARHLDISAHVIRRHLPETCREIAALHRRYCKARAEAKLAELKEEIRLAVEVSAREKRPFTVASVGQRLRKPGIFRSPMARAALEQLAWNF